MWRTHLGASLLYVFVGGVTVGFSPLSLESGSFPAQRHLDSASPTAPAETASVPTQVEGLFSSDDLLEFVLEANWDELDDDRDQESEERPGQAVWTSPEGQEFTIPIEIRTRGIFRLKKSTCSFPPFRLDFPSEGTEGTVFEGQDKVKLVTHCRDRDSYEQNVMEEYLAYRVYNTLTDVGFKVRPARITYVDSRGEDDPVTRMAFLLEDEDAMAARLEGQILEVAGAPASHFHQEQAGLMYIFQFMIGNTDWSMTRFHNVKVMRIGSDYFPIPYDFDFSGIVDAPYAGPNPMMAHLIDNVKQRLYWGACNDAIDYQALFAQYNDQRGAILALPSSVPGLSERNQRTAVSYLEQFYNVITNDRRADRMIMDACRR
ncbi:hypothetical protein ACFL3S_05355 [Gemmatimonadota bacterium]